MAYSNELMHVKIKNNDVLRDAVKKADGVVYQSVTSQLMCEGVLGKASGKTVVINNGVDPAGFGGRGFSLEGKNFLIACQFMHPMRRPELIADCWKKFVIGRPDAMLRVIMGENMSGVDFKGLPNVKVYPIMKQPELNEMMRACDALISVKYQDSCPNAVVESIACGTPAIVSNTNGLAKIIGHPWLKCAYIDPYRTTKEVDWFLPPTCGKDSFLRELISVYDTAKKELELPECLHIRNVAARYVEFFKELL